MCSTLIQLLKLFIVYLITQFLLFALYYYVIFNKESDRVLASFLVPLPLALFASFIYYLFAYMICNSEEN